MNIIKSFSHTQGANLIFSLLILVVFLIHLPELYQPCILHDEYGVWVDVAYLAGLDWSGITSISTYYSFVYSFLLVPLFWFVKEPVAMYRVAILMNALMYVASYWISVKFARKFFKEEHPYVVEIICFVAVFYASNLFYVNMGWAESLLVLMFWVLLYTIYRYFETDKWWLAILVSIEAVYMYMIHMRTLGVVIAVILSLLIYEVSKKKINWKNALLFILCTVAMFLIATEIKQLLIDNLYCWNNNRIASVNDYSGQAGK